MNLLKRELRVALSLRAQPIWFRVIKWISIIYVVRTYHSIPNFWWGALGIFLLAILFHFFYRFMTRAWTRPWGGWSDLDAGK